MSAALRWTDRVYGDAEVVDEGILGIVHCPTFQRLLGVMQAGPSAIAFPFKTVTRYEHSLGVYLLLRRLGADRKEQVAGLLHDVSHTAFSHAVDFLVDSEEQDHHEEIKPEFLRRPDLAAAIRAAGFVPADFVDDSVFPLLERPLPWLCADRLDYFLRDSLACGVIENGFVPPFLEQLAVVDDTIACRDLALAREATRAFAEMNRDWWASPTEAYIYNEFAESLKEGFRRGVLNRADLLTDDAAVLKKLRDAGVHSITATLDAIRDFRPGLASGYVPRVTPKVRWIDPPVVVAGRLVRLSEIEESGGSGCKATG